MSGGQAPDDYGLQGGNLLAQNSDVELDHVRVTGGFALSGGGIANRNGHMTITNSLIDDNRASDGGGIFNYGGDGEAATLVLRDSTVAFNHAGHAGAISSRENELNSVALESATIARNAADEEYATGVGGVFFDSGTVSSHGSLIAHNLLADGSTQNCDQALSPSEGNNLESGTDCGFSAASDRAGATPDLATGLAQPRRRDRRPVLRRREPRPRHRGHLLGHRPDRRATAARSGL